MQAHPQNHPLCRAGGDALKSLRGRFHLRKHNSGSGVPTAFTAFLLSSLSCQCATHSRVLYSSTKRTTGKRSLHVAARPSVVRWSLRTPAELPLRKPCGTNGFLSLSCSSSTLASFAQTASHQCGTEMKPRRRSSHYRRLKGRGTCPKTSTFRAANSAGEWYQHLPSGVTLQDSFVAHCTPEISERAPYQSSPLTASVCHETRASYQTRQIQQESSFVTTLPSHYSCFQTHHKTFNSKCTVQKSDH